MSEIAKRVLAQGIPTGQKMVDLRRAVIVAALITTTMPAHTAYAASGGPRRSEKLLAKH
jgi:hypothetical protein